MSARVKSTKGNSRRTRDGLLVMVAIFGIIGSVVVFRSYAAHQIDTSTPGTFQFSKFEQNNVTGDVATIQLATQNTQAIRLHGASSLQIALATSTGHQYCLLGYYRTGAQIQMQLGQVGASASPTGDYFIDNPEPRELVCARTESTQANTPLTIRSNGDFWIQSIVVK